MRRRAAGCNPEPTPLRIAALVKQVPVAESLELGPDGRLVRDGTTLEMNPYCRRAVSKGVGAGPGHGGHVHGVHPRAAGGRGRPAGGGRLGSRRRGARLRSGVRRLRHAGHGPGAGRRPGRGRPVRPGARRPEFDRRGHRPGGPGAGGADRAAVRLRGPPAGAVAGGILRLDLELDDGWEEVEVALPALVSVAERLCDPCKVDPDGRQAVAAERLRRLTAADLGDGAVG